MRPLSPFLPQLGKFLTAVVVLIFIYLFLGLAVVGQRTHDTYQCTSDSDCIERGVPVCLYCPM